MNCLNQSDLQNWKLLPKEESILDSKQHDEPVERDSIGIKQSKPSKETESCKKSVEESDDGGNLNIWKWSLYGICTICSSGVAAASVCIIILGNNRENEFRFHIYTNDKMIKKQQSRKLDETTLCWAVPSSQGLE